MNREVEIVASDWDTCFTMKSFVGGESREFRSLFAAARHARSISGAEGDVMVIVDELGETMSRIPFNL